MSTQQQQTNDQQLFGGNLELTMDVVSHCQRIADRTGDPILKETASRAHAAFTKGQADPNVHLTWITPEQANELVKIAVRTQDRELADFARYCQSVAATSQVGLEPSPGKIQQELEKGRQELQEKGQVHTGPGYGPAFASLSGKNLKLTPDIVAQCQSIADRTGDEILKQTASRAQSALDRGQTDPNVHLTWITAEQANELVNIAIRTQDRELADFARYCQSVAATTQVGLEPTPGKIQEEIQKGKQELQQQGPAHTGPGYGAAFATQQQQQGQ